VFTPAGFPQPLRAARLDLREGFDVVLVDCAPSSRSPTPWPSPASPSAYSCRPLRPHHPRPPKAAKAACAKEGATLFGTC
jgi:hypothetical protein